MLPPEVVLHHVKTEFERREMLMPVVVPGRSIVRTRPWKYDHPFHGWEGMTIKDVEFHRTLILDDVLGNMTWHALEADARIHAMNEGDIVSHDCGWCNPQVLMLGNVDDTYLMEFRCTQFVLAEYRVPLPSALDTLLAGDWG